MTVKEFKRILKKKKSQTEIVSVSPNFELKNQLVALKNISICRCRISKMKYFNPGQNKTIEYDLYNRNEKDGAACLKLFFYGPERIKPTAKGLLKAFAQVEEDIPLVANSPNPDFLFSMVGLSHIKTQKLQARLQTFTDAFDHTPIETLIYIPDEQGNRDGLILEF